MFLFIFLVFVHPSRRDFVAPQDERGCDSIPQDERGCDSIIQDERGCDSIP